MPGHLPSLDAESLARLRDLVRTLHEENGSGVPMRNLIALCEGSKLNAGITIDFAATATLGQPMVVLRVPTTPIPHSSLKSLTKREHEVATLVAQGLRNKDIAKKLFISLPTVKDHVHRILQKTGLPGRAGIVTAVLGRHSAKD